MIKQHIYLYLWILYHILLIFFLTNIEQLLNIDYTSYKIYIKVLLVLEASITKKEEQHETRKWQILDIALNHFIKYGFHGTSTRKIAKEAGISSGLMFHYFPNKLALYEALVEIGCENIIIEVEENDSPMSYFEKQVEYFLSVITQNSFSTRMFVFMGSVAITAKYISNRSVQMMKENDIETMSVPYIKQGQELGLIRPGDPLTLSVLFYSSIQGFAETLVARDNLILPEKEWFLAILRKQKNEIEGMDTDERKDEYTR